MFEFFSDARNLEAITPDFLRFRLITSPPIPMAEGTLIDYRLSLHGAPLRWRTRIEAWVPGQRFVDLQLSGPYRLWRHTHTFEDVPGGTRMSDEVEYRCPSASSATWPTPCLSGAGWRRSSTTAAK